MPSILFAIGRIYRNQFNWNDLKKKKNFLNFLAAYMKSTSNGPQLEKKDDFQKLCIFEIRDGELCG